MLPTSPGPAIVGAAVNPAPSGPAAEEVTVPPDSSGLAVPTTTASPPSTPPATGVPLLPPRLHSTPTRFYSWRRICQARCQEVSTMEMGVDLAATTCPPVPDPPVVQPDAAEVERDVDGAGSAEVIAREVDAAGAVSSPALPPLTLRRQLGSPSSTSSHVGWMACCRRLPFRNAGARHSSLEKCHAAAAVSLVLLLNSNWESLMQEQGKRS